MLLLWSLGEILNPLKGGVILPLLSFAFAILYVLSFPFCLGDRSKYRQCLQLQ